MMWGVLLTMAPGESRIRMNKNSDFDAADLSSMEPAARFARGALRLPGRAAGSCGSLTGWFSPGSSRDGKRPPRPDRPGRHPHRAPRAEGGAPVLPVRVPADGGVLHPAAGPQRHGERLDRRGAQLAVD